MTYQQIGKIIQLHSQFINHEEEAVLYALDDNGVIWEYKYITVKIKIGTIECQRLISGGSGRQETFIKDVIRIDSYMQWVPVTIDTGRHLLRKGQGRDESTNASFKRCEEEIIND